MLVGAAVAPLVGAVAVIATIAIPAAANTRRSALAILSVAPCCRRGCSRVQCRCWLHAAVQSVPPPARYESSAWRPSHARHGHHHDVIEHLNTQHRALRQATPDVCQSSGETGIRPDRRALNTKPTIRGARAHPRSESSPPMDRRRNSDYLAGSPATIGVSTPTAPRSDALPGAPIGASRPGRTSLKKAALSARNFCSLTGNS